MTPSDRYACVTPDCQERLRGSTEDETFCSICLADLQPVDPLHCCDRCGAVTFDRPCTCTRDVTPAHHEAMHLFEPVATMRGQTTMELP